MKHLFLLSLLVITTAFFTSCSNDDDGPLPAENTGLDFFANLNILNTFIDHFDLEFGQEFSSSKDGSITEFVLKLPDTATYRVSLWDSATESLLASDMVSATDNAVSKKTITPIAITAGKKYFITVQSNDWDLYIPQSGQNLYPATHGSITFHRYGSASGTDQRFPTAFGNNTTAGIVGITFQP